MQQKQEQTKTENKPDTDELTTWAQNLKAKIPKIDYDALADKIASIVTTPEIKETDYLEDNYFEPFFWKMTIYL